MRIVITVELLNINQPLEKSEAEFSGEFCHIDNLDSTKPLTHELAFHATFCKPTSADHLKISQAGLDVISYRFALVIHRQKIPVVAGKQESRNLN